MAGSSKCYLEDSMGKYKETSGNCSGLIFCSLYEGLGLPPIEGMNCGCPLLLSDIEPLHETCHDAAVFVNPLDVEEIAEGMMKLASNNGLWSLRSFQVHLLTKRKPGMPVPDYLKSTVNPG